MFCLFFFLCFLGICGSLYGLRFVNSPIPELQSITAEHDRVSASPISQKQEIATLHPIPAWHHLLISPPGSIVEQIGKKLLIQELPSYSSPLWNESIPWNHPSSQERAEITKTSRLSTYFIRRVLSLCGALGARVVSEPDRRDSLK